MTTPSIILNQAPVTQSEYVWSEDIPVQGAEYNHDRWIGSGGFGNVYRVVEQKTGNVFALKAPIWESDKAFKQACKDLKRSFHILKQLNTNRY